MRLGEVLWLELVLILGRVKVDDWDLVGRNLCPRQESRLECGGCFAVEVLIPVLRLHPVLHLLREHKNVRLVVVVVESALHLLILVLDVAIPLVGVVLLVLLDRYLVQLLQLLCLWDGLLSLPPPLVGLVVQGAQKV